jgi:hypothetical protein
MQCNDCAYDNSQEKEEMIDKMLKVKELAIVFVNNWPTYCLQKLMANKLTCPAAIFFIH